MRIIVTFLTALAAAAVCAQEPVSVVAEQSPAQTETFWSRPGDQEIVLQDMKTFFSGAETRHPGSRGNLLMEERIAERFAATGLEHGKIRFRAPAFMPGKTTLTLEGQEPVDLLPMHPTLFRPGNFTEKEFSAPLVYLGRGTVEDLERLEGINLDGAIALMEFNSGTAWLRFNRFGIRGFVFIGDRGYERFDALSKVYASEVSVPRFFVQADQGELLKKAAQSENTAPLVQVRAEPSRWENRFLRNLWVLIPGTHPDRSREVCVITAPIDSNCIVPELAAGAQAGGNLFLLMKLLDDFTANPPDRSILLTAVNAHTQNFRGERMLAWYLLADGVEKVRDLLNSDLREQRLLLDYHEKLNLDTFRQEDEDTLIEWRTLVDDSTGRNITVKDSLVALARRDVNSIKEQRLHLLLRHGEGEISDAELRTSEKALEEQMEKHVSVLTLFNRVGVRTALSELTDEETDILRGYVDDVIRFNSSAAALNARDLEIDMQNSAIRDVLGGRRVPFVICLDLDWTTHNIGFSSMRTLGRRGQGERWGSVAYNTAQEMEAVREGRKPNLLMDTITLRGGLSEDYYFDVGSHLVVQRSPVSYFNNANRTPAFNLMNVFSRRGESFLPTDTINRLNASNLAESMAFVTRYFRALFDNRATTAPSELPPADIARLTHPLWSVLARTYKYDELAASVYPDIPVEGSAVIVRPQNLLAHLAPLHADAITCGEVVNADISLTDERATIILYGLRANKVNSVFRLDKDFISVDHVIDAGDTHNKIDSNNMRVDELMLALFRCHEFPIYATTDPSMIGADPIAITEMLPLGAGDAAPRKFGLTGISSPFSSKIVNPTAGAPAAFYFCPSEYIKFLTASKRLALNATPERYEGRGFISPDQLGPDIFAAMAGDMSIMNRARLTRLRDVANELVSIFLERGEESLTRMREAASQGSHLKYLVSLYEALGSQVKSYEQAKQTSDDMLKAVVVYMALLLPFCMFIQKLMFKFVKIEHELGMFAVLFVATFLLFRLIHPAFRIAEAAEAIFVAFVMGALGLFVISILRSRFEGEMQLLFKSYLSGVHEDVGYSTVTQKALVIGVNNMKRRRIRTMLTTATIVLIAFTMLSFTSISKKISPTIVLRSREAPYTGMMYHWPGISTMDEATLNVFKELFAHRGDLIVRRWLIPEDNAPLYVRTRTENESRFRGVLGLSAKEEGFLDSIPLAKGRFLASDDINETLVSVRSAELLNIDLEQPESTFLSIRGRELKVVGIFDDERFRQMRDLNNRPLLPVARVAVEDEEAARLGEEEGEIDEALLSYVDPSSLLVVPVNLAKRMGAEPYSVSVKMPADTPIWPAADLFLTSTMARFYISSVFPFAFGDRDQSVAAGIYYIGSNYSTSIGGLAVLLIPLFIASTIIFNTMLGSVYERKKEIAVYNAVGLNPHHIGMFFLAESFVYGVIGSVGGYLIGQMLSIALDQFGWVQDINLNYSSLSVAYVIIFTISIVLLSTLYPASVATKAAVPSGKRKWSLPEHEDEVMNIIFPFIYHPRVAVGVLAYLDEYFSRFTEASIGDLIAKLENKSHTTDAQGRDRFQIEYDVALAPYDLGVTQLLTFDLAFDNRVQAYQLGLRIKRVSGQDSNWATTNRPFLEQLRKYLLRWRNLDISQHGLYVQEAKMMFALKTNKGSEKN